MSNKITLTLTELPSILQNIPHSPKELYLLGQGMAEIMARPRIAIVGSRKVTAYGRSITEKLAGELASSGVVIVSGLALGVDGIAHQAALNAGGMTVAVLPSSLSSIYPSTHRQLAKRIIREGGTVISEYPDGTQSFKQNFIERNRLVSGLSDAVLITEAAKGSGTLHTARFAKQQGKPVLAVPGNITSPMSHGTNYLIKHGAAVITDSKDIFKILGLTTHTLHKSTIQSARDNPDEQRILDLIVAGTHDGSELLARSNFEVAKFNQTLTMLEITGAIKNQGNNQWMLA